MKWPWVSRELFDDRRERINELAALVVSERERIMEILRTERVQSGTVLVALQSRYDALQAKHDALIAQVIDFKRHEVGMAPTAFDLREMDPMHDLGPRTQMAIETFAAGDKEMRKYLLARATMEMAVLRGQTSDVDAIDSELASLILNGDQ
jgi:hypothetical protein